MVIYKAFYKNDKLKKAEFMGMLIERRKDLRRKIQVESGLKWARLTFGRMVEDKEKIFVVPNELKLGSDTQWLMEKEVFTKEELVGMARPVDREMKKIVSSFSLPPFSSY
jgi:hypothetical protein